MPCAQLYSPIVSRWDGSIVLIFSIYVFYVVVFGKALKACRSQPSRIKNRTPNSCIELKNKKLIFYDATKNSSFIIGIKQERTNQERKKEHHSNTSNRNCWGWIHGGVGGDLRFLLVVFVLAILVTLLGCTLLVNTPPTHNNFLWRRQEKVFKFHNAVRGAVQS